MKQREHGSPADRGSADAYYGRPSRPHKWPSGTNKGYKVTDLTIEEVMEYDEAYENEEDRKDWGD